MLFIYDILLTKQINQLIEKINVSINSQSYHHLQHKFHQNLILCCAVFATSWFYDTSFLR